MKESTKASVAAPPAVTTPRLETDPFPLGPASSTPSQSAFRRSSTASPRAPTGL
jgi:hypothetical protein